MTSAYFLVIACGLLALAYGWFTSRQVLSANAGTARMQEISGAVQVGAKAYLNRQYRAIAIVGVVVLIILGITLGLRVAIGYLIGAVLSAAAGYVGMNVSVRANVRTAVLQSPSRLVRSPACWWSGSVCSESGSTISSCALHCRATICARCSKRWWG
jgi:K(+)-stimulated pyrophosphate-energized sodium pump